MINNRFLKFSTLLCLLSISSLAVNKEVLTAKDYSGTQAQDLPADIIVIMAEEASDAYNKLEPIVKKYDSKPADMHYYGFNENFQNINNMEPYISGTHIFFDGLKINEWPDFDGILEKKWGPSGYAYRLDGLNPAVVVAFRGSWSTKDWQTNAQLSGQEVDKILGGTLHKGFYTIANSFIPHLDPVFEKLRITDKDTFYFTGHSLGGAIAQICAGGYISLSTKKQISIKDSLGEEKIIHLTPNQVKSITFSAPMPGDRVLDIDVEKKLGVNNILNFYSSADPVPYLPPFNSPIGKSISWNYWLFHDSWNPHSIAGEKLLRWAWAEFQKDRNSRKWIR